ncbi:tRNA (adenosine(37)-N6)-threonylcarbamoyltransferase complex dimerization subunit type 1 TsaB [Flavobacterium davisii]|uniref:tRNA (Adenosine(37)-N6)-threonylcarbamoyltransferase complex dimerization subunit type 1 TsaB n=1 Tax=Flavobacterium davisii TaxID=2906077 RepID=A0A246GI64_9FLAO|nr:tRNA (adenosine(37)-N6)-threonylcarbamoyltransferase complex dimerization subunit type 1 TsaB [Flavobacterium davisii]OWP83792.1 tRNA (adenosine(37)-N6)-threonylcarbamoyltransferase complex dimerization subunit type 1 TsaB [Flavobacterium davisii]
MTYILHLETATRNCSVSLAKEGELLAVREIAESGYTHAEKLHVFIEEVLDKAQIKINDLVAIAVSQGPGSYTGLRIGVSAAKGLCYALNIPLIAVDTLETLARQIKVSEGMIIPMIDARRMECYTAVFSNQYELQRKVESQIIDSNVFSEFQEKIHLLGDGAFKCKEVLNTAQFIYHEQAIFPSSKEMVGIAYQKFLNQDFVDVAYFEPFYLKEFMLNTK